MKWLAVPFLALWVGTVAAEESVLPQGSSEPIVLRPGTVPPVPVQNRSPPGDATPSATKPPLPPPQLKPEELQVLSIEAYKVASDGINQTILFFGFFLTFLVGVFGILTAVLQLTFSRRTETLMKQEVERVKEEMERTIAQAGFEQKQLELEQRMHTRFTEFQTELTQQMEQHMEESVHSALRDEYQWLIGAYTEAAVMRALMLAPQVRDVVFTRTQELASQFCGVLEQHLGGKEPADALYKVLIGAITSWQTLYKLYSMDREQVLLGLADLRAQPFIQAETRLEELLQEYKGDVTMLSAVKKAEEALRNLKIERNDR